MWSSGGYRYGWFYSYGPANDDEDKKLWDASELPPEHKVEIISTGKRSLADYLAVDPLDIETQSIDTTDIIDTLPDTTETTDLCVECLLQHALVKCIECDDNFCEVCFARQHRSGKRIKHTAERLPRVHHNTLSPKSIENWSLDSWNAESWKSRCSYIPLRLTLHERRVLRLVESVCDVSEYTSRLDVLAFSKKPKRVYAQLREICGILAGLAISADFNLGKEMIASQDYVSQAAVYQGFFEIARRHKIRNPEKMRDSYGKLLYFLMDTVSPDIQELLQFSCVRPMRTVASFLEEKEAASMLTDQKMMFATAPCPADGKSRYQLQQDIERKENYRRQIVSEYRSSKLSEEDIRLCFSSIEDNNSYLASSSAHCDTMIKYLSSFFHPDNYSKDFSLAIKAGADGARLTHSHDEQYSYVLQSLTLWREITHDMFRLWLTAESDLLNPTNPYELIPTGQGLHRMQKCPLVSKAMYDILHRSRSHWVGSSVVHLGDRAVPNALMFIDKYNQVSRILSPICTCLRNIERLFEEDESIDQYVVRAFGSIHKLKLRILCDFFKFAFDGSGADNFYDAGSCVDGRLTSAWHWCSQIASKSFYPIFLLSGFTGFDGAFFV